MLLDQARSWQVPFHTVVADAGYGIPSFLRALDERQLPYVCAVASDFGVRLLAEMEQANPHPIPAQHPRGGRAGGHPKNPRPAPRHDANAVADSLRQEAWQTVEWREGGRGPLCKQFVAIRVHAGTGCARHSQTHGRSWTGPEGWLLGERPLPGEEGKPKWFLSNLPASTPLPRLVELAHLRWPVEQFSEDGKGECGLGDYQGRTWERLHWPRRESSKATMLKMSATTMMTATTTNHTLLLERVGRWDGGRKCSGLFPPEGIPVSPITTLSGVQVLLCVILLGRVKRGWPVLWRTLLVASGGTFIATIVLLWPSPPGIYLSQWLDPALTVIIPVVGYGFASRTRVKAE